MIATLNAENHIWYQQLSLCTLFHLTSPCTQTHMLISNSLKTPSCGGQIW